MATKTVRVNQALLDKLSSEVEASEDVVEVWETVYRPLIRRYKRVPVELVAEIMGFDSKAPVESMLRARLMPCGWARKDPTKSDGTYVYEIFPIMFIAWYEGRMAISDNRTAS